jgi:hypothetical protein
MSDVRIIAVSLEGGEQLEHLTHVWTVDGAMSKQRAVEEIWAGRNVLRRPADRPRRRRAGAGARPNLIASFFGRRVEGDLESPRGASLMDGLLTLPRLPSPTRPRRSRAMAARRRHRSRAPDERLATPEPHPEATAPATITP